MEGTKMKKDNDGLKLIVYTFIIFFGITWIGILFENAGYWPNTPPSFYASLEFENTLEKDWQSTEREYNDMKNSEAKDRVDRDEAKTGDYERAAQWDRDHSA
jgi:hypothetical protein